MEDNAFDQIFPLGEKNDSFAQYFIGQSYLAPLATGTVPSSTTPTPSPTINEPPTDSAPARRSESSCSPSPTSEPTTPAAVRPRQARQERPASARTHAEHPAEHARVESRVCCGSSFQELVARLG